MLPRNGVLSTVTTPLSILTSLSPSNTFTVASVAVASALVTLTV